MWPLLPLILLIALIPGCNRKEEKDSPNSTNPPPPKPIEKDIFYRSSCLVDNSCPEEERKAAIHDYVGAVYGESGKVQFTESDGKQRLTVAEKDYVEKQFGLLTGLDQNKIDPYLSNARATFFGRSSFPIPKHCPEFPPVSLSQSRLGEGLVLYGAHGCGKELGNQLSESGLELSIAAHPQDWTFFIEGLTAKAENLGPEVKLVEKISDTLGIPRKEALKYNPTHPEVLEAASKKSGYRREELMVGALFQVLIDRYTENPGLDQKATMTQIVHDYASYFGVDESTLRKEMNDFLIKYGRDQVAESGKRMLLLAEVSNQLSKAPLKVEIEKLADEKKRRALKEAGLPSTNRSLFLVGQKHLELIKRVYENESR